MRQVTFAPYVVVHTVPSGTEEDRSSPWMQLAINRCHFQRRIQKVEILIVASLLKRQKTFKDFQYLICMLDEEIGSKLVRSPETQITRTVESKVASIDR